MHSPRQAGMLLLIWIGGSAIITQSYLLRELLNLFAGNELNLGIAFAVWLLASALGAACGDLISRRTRSAAGLTVAAMTLLAPLLPLSPIAIQAYRSVSRLPYSASFPPGQVLLASILFLALPAFLHAFLFPLACSLSRDPVLNPDGLSGQGYAIESLGALAGGVLAILLLTPMVNPVWALAASAMVGLCCTGLLAAATEAGELRRCRRLAIIGIMAAGLVVTTLAGTFDALERLAVSAAHPYARVIRNGFTRYQKLTLLALEGQHTLMASGTPLLTLPHPDDGSSEASAMIPFLAADRPSSILIIGGVDGLPRHLVPISAIRRIDCLEADPGVLDALNLVPDASTLLGLNDPRIRLIREDPRKWLAGAGERYDLVLVALPPPVTLAANRFHTVEFHRLLAGRLTDDGIVAIILPGSEIYLSPRLSGMLSSITQALKETLPFIERIPGGQSLILASRSNLQERLTIERLASRLEALGITTRFVTAGYLMDRMAPDRLTWFRKELARSPAPANRDSSPVAAWHAIALHVEQQKGEGTWLAKLFAERNVFPLAALLLIAAGVPPLVARRDRRMIWLGSMTGTGFTAMALQLLLMLAYQSHTGLIYQGVALFTALFMAGSAFGVYLAEKLTSRIMARNQAILADSGLLLLAGIFALIFLAGISTFLVFFMLTGATLAGMLTGLQFNAVTRLVSGQNSAGARPGLVYAADLFGACIGGLLAGLALIPQSGFGGTCVILAAIKALQCIILVRTKGVTAEGGSHD